MESPCVRGENDIDVHTHPPLIRDDRADVAFRNISTENLKYLNSQQAYVARLDPTRDISLTRGFGHSLACSLADAAYFIQTYNATLDKVPRARACTTLVQQPADSHR